MKILSLFDGISCGMQALKNLNIPIEKYYASEIDKYAIEVSRKNHPEIIQLGDIENWKEWDIEWDEIDMVIGGSPCFEKGTKVICKNGYKNIEDIVVGDEVLTHKNRFKRVVRIGNKQATTVTLKAQGITDTQVTLNHPYYVRKVERKNGVVDISEPSWVKVKDLEKGHYIGIPINQLEENILNLTESDSYILGRYTADGHTAKYHRSGERSDERVYNLILSIGDKKTHNFDLNKDKLPHFTKLKHGQSVYRYNFHNKRLVELAENECKCGALNKTISNNILNLPQHLSKIFLDSYMEGDGCFTKGHYKCTTSSLELALSLSRLITKVYGCYCNVNKTKVEPTKTIEGRVVNQHDYYNVIFHKEKKEKSKPFIIDDIVWLPFKGISNEQNDRTVYNIEVEEDHSYTANNAIVHNCQGFTFAGKRLNFDDHRSKLYFTFYEILSYLKVKNPSILFLLENVKMESKCKKAIDEMLGVEGVLINSNLFSAQNRQRYYWTNIPIAELPTDSPIVLKDILKTEDNDNSRLPVSKIHLNAWLKNYKWKSDDVNGKSKPLLASYYKQPPHCPYVQYRDIQENENELKESVYRRLSPIECERLQTLPDNYTLVTNEKGNENSFMQRYKMLGNGWTVAVISHIFSSLENTI